jgi:queuosine precursor transporter
MTPKNKNAELGLFIILTSLFIAALITCNLIANKFVSIDLGFKTFIVSAGILPYPITFLITDILSEIYGRKMTNRVVISGFFASIMVLLFLWIGSLPNALESSPVGNDIYNTVFRNAWRVMAASMIAYLSAQFLDVRLFHFWKNLTKGKHLWLRNNASTIGSQFVDTTLVICILFIGVWSNGDIIQAIIDGWTFKMLCALIDTPIFYITTSYLRKKFNLKLNEEVVL